MLLVFIDAASVITDAALAFTEVTSIFLNAAFAFTVAVCFH